MDCTNPQRMSVRAVARCGWSEPVIHLLSRADHSVSVLLCKESVCLQSGATEMLTQGTGRAAEYQCSWEGRRLQRRVFAVADLCRGGAPHKLLPPQKSETNAPQSMAASEKSYRCCIIDSGMILPYIAVYICNRPVESRELLGDRVRSSCDIQKQEDGGN